VMVPLPALRSPFQRADALRSMMFSFELIAGDSMRWCWHQLQF
jgi:hypothetical protein